MRVAVVRYNAGNTTSVCNALRRLGVEPVVTDDADELRAADRVVFPGVGEARSAMRSLRTTGLDALLPTLQQPFLGICLGMQLLCRESEENDTECLGVFPAAVVRNPPGTVSPHMGWNVVDAQDHALFRNVPKDSRFYFAHGYRVEDGPVTTAHVDHDGRFSAALSRDNFHAVQFHPEKSAAVGARVLQNFLEGP